MWPLRAAELRELLAPVAVPLERDGAATEDDEIFRAIGWVGPRPGPIDVFFALDARLHELVPTALEAGATCVVAKAWPGKARLEPSLRRRCLEADSPLQAYRRLAGALRDRFTFPVVAVGGSNGKTTTKELVASVLSAGGRLVTATPGTNNGWVGLPITLCEPRHRRESPPAALAIEIGIDERGAMREHVALVRPDVAILTALGPEHLAGLGSHEDAIREELELFAGAKQRVWLADEPALAARLHEARPGDVVVAGRGAATVPGVETLAFEWRANGPSAGRLRLEWRGESVEAALPLPGAHNGRNAALAVATALLLGSSLAEAAAALARFTPPKQRCSVVELASGVTLIDDTYNASPSSVEAALDVLEAFEPRRERVVVLGDMLDLGAASERCHRELAPRLARLAGAHVRLFGDEMPKLAPSLSDASSVGVARADEEPSSLLDLGLAEDAVVLVKGSRGMALERVVQHVASVHRRTSPPLDVAVAGSGAEYAARALRAALLARMGPDVVPARVRVRSLDVAALESGAALRRAHRFVVLVGFAAAADPERELAAIAQLFVHLPDGGVAFLPEEEQEIAAVLAEVVPPHARTRKARASDLVALVATEIERTLRAEHSST